jgi:hypothetical protein
MHSEKVKMTAVEFAARTGLALEEWGLDNSYQVTVWADGHANALSVDGAPVYGLSAGNDRARARCVAAHAAACVSR